MKLAVAGIGYVGLSIATLLSQHHEVMAVDIVPEKVEKINNKISPIQDEYIEQYLAEMDLNLTATLDAEAAYKDADFVVIAAPTNYETGGIWEEGQIQYYMRSHESGSHHRAHVHVNAEHKYDASVDILTGKVLEGKLGKYEKKVIKKVSDNQEFLLQCWNDMTDGLKVDIDYHLKMHD